MSKICEYYFVLHSPFAYLGHRRLTTLAKRAPNCQAYRLNELQCWSEHLGLSLNLQPIYFPVHSDEAGK